MMNYLNMFDENIWNNPNLTVPKDIAEKYNIDKKFYEKEETENNEHSD